MNWVNRLEYNWGFRNYSWVWNIRTVTIIYSMPKSPLHNVYFILHNYCFLVQIPPISFFHLYLWQLLQQLPCKFVLDCVIVNSTPTYTLYDYLYCTFVRHPRVLWYEVVALKGCLRYKTTTQDVSSEMQVKNFFIS